MCRYGSSVLWTLVLVAVLVFDGIATVRSEFESQPKLQTHDGSLLLEAVRDRNITLRMRGEAALLVNEVNVLEVIRRRFSPTKLEGGENGAPAPLEPDAVVLQLQSLKRALQRMTTRLGAVENRTRTTLGSRRIRRFLGRLRRLSDRLTQAQQNLVLDECERQPCRNGGYCLDLYKDFHCECPTGWSGKTCEEDVDECYALAGSDLGCQNNAVCVNTPGSYSCTCAKGFSGSHCRLRKAACDSPQAAELCGHGVCVHASNDQGYTCLCDQGWARDNVTNACSVDVDECQTMRNRCHSECINLPGGFRCGPCPHGYTGDGVTCLDVDECAANNGGCSLAPRVLCINTEGSSLCGNCPPGWRGDGRQCERTPSTSCDAENVCHPRARCEYISGTAVCTCPPGWNGHGFGANGCSIDSGRGRCDNHECKNNGTCIVSGRGTYCVCPLGYSGPLCEQADACNPNPCLNGGTCSLLPGRKFRCTCPRGTTGNSCETLRPMCGSIINQEAGELTYPPDGNAYGPNERCALIIRTANTKILNVTFDKFDLEESPDCGKDWLQIHDGRSLAAQLIGRFCGKTLPLGGNIVSSHQQLFLWFRSDNTTHGGGIKLSWTSQEHTCGGELSLNIGDNGVIRSPGYPGKMPANRECEWQLRAPFGQRLIVRFYEVNLGGDVNCTKDTLKVFDADQLLGAICETRLPAPMHSSSNKVLLHLHTDGQRSDSSFQLHYEVVPGDPNCGGLFTDPSGVFAANPKSPVCQYLIQQPTGTKIQLDFTELHSTRSANCDLLNIQIFDGKTDEDPLLNRFCLYDKLETVVSSGNFVLVRYEHRLPNLLSEQQVETKYERVCGDRFFGPDDGEFATPNYPKPYVDHLTCTYNIYGPIDTVVVANFTDFSLSESTPDMSEDQGTTNTNATRDVDDYANYVDVYLSRDTKRRYYKGEPMSLVAAGNHMRIIFHSNRNQRRSRGIRVEYSFEHLGCGGVFTEPAGNFWKTAVGDWSDRDTPNCEWLLEAPEGKAIRLYLSVVRIGRPCTAGEETVWIYSGAQHLFSFCEPSNIDQTFHTNQLRVVMKKLLEPNPAAKYSVVANYSFVDEHTECGGNFSYRFGVIKTPGWPKPYPLGLDCTWIITAPLGHKIELETRNFSLETTSMERCTDDYLEIRNGRYENSPLIGRYCGRNLPSRLPSFGNQMHLHFHSDFYVADEGFYLTWEQTATGCGGKLNSHKGSIHSPHYPDIPGGAVVCTWEIRVAEGSQISVNVSSPNSVAALCSNDMLTIYDGPDSLSDVLTHNCSRDKDLITLRSSGNQLLVRYTVSDGSRGQQFLLDYEIICNMVLSAPLGVIESPNFPDPYPPNMNCEWIVLGGKSNKVSLAFSHLRLEQVGDQCTYDYVEVIDMRDDDVLKTHRVCSNPPDVFKTEGNKLRLKFVSDYNNAAQGFRAEYKRLGCGEHFYTSRGSFESPNTPYSVNVVCTWLIEAPAGKQIVLTIDEFHMESVSDTESCATDSLLVANKINATFPLLKTCTTEQRPVTVTSAANRMFVEFSTSEKRARKYLKASYVFQEAACGGVFTASSGVITSPNYPQRYPTNTECTWNIILDNAYGVRATFERFDLPNTTYCQDSYLEYGVKGIFTRFNTLERSCGSQLPRRFVTYSNQLNLTFHAGQLTPQSGFVMKYEKSCIFVISEPSGFLSSSQRESCFWAFSLPEGSKISIDILHLECDCEEKKCPVIFQGGNAENGLNLCKDRPGHLTFPTNQLSIRNPGMKFRARYTSVQNTCGGELTSLSGSLASPYYPNPYPSGVECVWDIQPRKGNSIEVTLEFLNITSSDRCNGDFLEMRSSDSGSLIGLYCGNELPAETLTSFEQMWIKFRSTEDSTGMGFKLRWNYAHMNSLNGTQGSIESPPINDVKREAEPYVWRIMVARGSLISITFSEYHKGLNLYDGFDENAINVDIKTSPWEFTSGTNVVLLTSDNAELEMFKIDWKAVSKAAVEANSSISECHEEITLPIRAYVNLSSPGYPKNYADNLDCQWTVKVEDPTQHAVQTLFNVDIEETQGCAADSLKVSSSSNLVDWHQEKNLCQRDSEGLLVRVHGTPNLKVDFHTDSSINARGFTTILSTACGSNMTGPVGSIKSTQFHGIVNSTCLWHIEVRPGRLIEFTIDYNRTQLSPSTVGCRDYALIYDGLDENAPLLDPGQICNMPTHDVRRLVTSSNHAIVKYKITRRDEWANRWNLTYREFSDCGGEVRLTHSEPTFNISSPRYPNIPHPHTECSWIVLAPAGETVQLDFVDRFDLNARYCSKEFVEFFDGATTMSRSLGRFCVKPQTMRTSGNLLRVHYLTDIAEPRNGFRLRVSLSTCGGTITDISGVISSVNYPAPGSYPPFADCAYVFKQAPHLRLKLNFSDLHLPFDDQNLNNSDRLEISIAEDGGAEPFVVLYGNETKMPVLELDSKEVTMRFRTHQANHLYRGFKLRFSHIFGICFKDVTDESGTFSLSNSLRNSMIAICNWKITVPKGRRVRLEFVNLDLLHPTTPGSFSSYLQQMRRPRMFDFTIYNDHVYSSKIAEFDLMSYNSSTVIQSTDNLMFIHMQLSSVGYLSELKRVQLRYTSDEESLCPEDISDFSSGSISLHPLTETSTNFYCRIRFSLKEQETIAFNISELRMGPPVVANMFGRYPVTFRDEASFSYSKLLRDNLTNTLVALTTSRGSISFLQTTPQLRILKFEATYRRHPCGGRYDLADGFVLNSPDLMNSDYGNLDCVWLLNAGVARTNYRLLGNVSLSQPCEDEYIAIYSGVRIENGEVARICRDSAPFNGTLLENKYASIAYHARDYKAGQSSFSFVVEKSVPCGVHTRVSFSSSNKVVVDPSTYKNNMECSFEFSINEGFYLRLSYPGRFYIEDSPNCTKDYLEVQRFESGLWISDGRHCGREVPVARNFTTNRLRLIFRTDGNITGDGFTVQVNHTCSATFNVTTATQAIQSPMFRGMHMFGVVCQYTFLADSQFDHINVRIADQRRITSPVARCELFSITAYKKDHEDELLEAEKYCGEGDGRTEMRALRYLRLDFRAIIDKSIRIEFELDSCGGAINKPTTIRSVQGESNNYIDDMNCVWNVTAPPDHSIVLQFKYFEMEPNRECAYDSLSVYAGTAITMEKRVSQLCGNLTAQAPTVVVDTNRAVVTAVSDASGTYRGFLAQVHFTPNCNERIALADDNSPVTLVRRLSFNASEVLLCYYRIMAPTGYRVRLDIKDVQLAASGCEANSLEIFDSLEAKRASLGKFCTNRRSELSLYSSHDDVVLKVSATQFGKYSFEIVLQMEPSLCGIQQELRLEDAPLVVQFPARNNSAALYPPNTHCKWRIDSEHKIFINLNEVALQNVSQISGKCLDYLQIKSRFMSKIFCGNVENFQLPVPRLRNTFVEITFHSDASIEGKGFRLTALRGSACNNTYTKTSGMISYQTRANSPLCQDIILVPSDHFVTLHILSFRLEEGNCSSNFLRVNNFAANKTIRTFCHSSYSETPIATNSNAIQLEHTAKNLRLFYVANRNTSQPGCGGIINTPDGDFSNPVSYQDRNQSECRWDIVMPIPNKIRLSFITFDMGSTVNCVRDFVRIIEVDSEGNERISETYCGQEIVDTYISQNSHVAIVAKKSPNFDGTGWSLSFSAYEDPQEWDSKRFNEIYV